MKIYLLTASINKMKNTLVNKNEYDQFIRNNKNLDNKFIEGFEVSAIQWLDDGLIVASCLYKKIGKSIIKSFYLAK